MLSKIVGGAVLGAIVGAGVGIGVSASDLLDSATAATRARFADLLACPSASGVIGRLPGGHRVLLTAVGPDGQFYELHYPLSPNGYAWINADLVEPDESTASLPVQNCREILDVGRPTAAPTVTPSATPAPTLSPTPPAATETPTVPPTPTATVAPTAPPTPAPTATPTPRPTPPPTAAPTPPPTAMPTVPPDNTPPTIQQESVNPSQIFEDGSQQCPQGMTVEVSAFVADAGGLDRVRVRYTLADVDGETRRNMSLQDGQYRAEVGPFVVDANTEVFFTIIAVDDAGNRSEEPVEGPVTVVDCG